MVGSKWECNEGNLIFKPLGVYFCMRGHSQHLLSSLVCCAKVLNLERNAYLIKIYVNSTHQQSEYFPLLWKYSWPLPVFVFLHVAKPSFHFSLPFYIQPPPFQVLSWKSNMFPNYAGLYNKHTNHKIIFCVLCPICEVLSRASLSETKLSPCHLSWILPWVKFWITFCLGDSKYFIVSI